MGRGTARARGRPRPTVPCNNDLLAGNFIDDGERIWLIDYEYSGNNDACFELGNTATECDLDDDQVEALVAAYFGEARRRDLLARVRLQSLVLASTAGRSGASIQASAEQPRLRLRRLGAGALREGGATFRGPRFERLLEEVTGWLSCRPGPGW